MSKKLSREESLRQERRIMRMSIDLTLFGDIFRDGTNRMYSEGLPKSAIFLGASYSLDTYSCNFFYADESFERVEEGSVVPRLNVVLTQVHNPTNATKGEV